MAIAEEARHHLYQRLEEVLGPREAAVMMEHLPPVGWADVATTRDIDRLREEIERSRADRRRDLEFFAAEIRRDLDGLRVEMAERSNRLLMGMLASNSALVGLVLVISRIT